MIEPKEGGAVWRDSSVMFHVPEGVEEMSANIPLPADAERITGIFSARWPAGGPDVGIRLVDADGRTRYPVSPSGEWAPPSGQVRLSQEGAVEVPDDGLDVAVRVEAAERVVVSVGVEVGER